MRESRSQSPADLTLDLWPEHPRPQAPQSGAPRSRGVGGRQGCRRPPGGGGGYLNGRTPSELSADARLRELAEIGLSATWLAVAEQLGYDQFVAMWRLLSADAALRNDDNQIELRLRPFRAWERYQRNRYIATLVQSGLRPSEIHAMVEEHLGETLSTRHVKRLAARGKAQR